MCCEGTSRTREAAEGTRLGFGVSRKVPPLLPPTHSQKLHWSLRGKRDFADMIKGRSLRCETPGYPRGRTVRTGGSVLEKEMGQWKQSSEMWPQASRPRRGIGVTCPLGPRGGASPADPCQTPDPQNCERTHRGVLSHTRAYDRGAIGSRSDPGSLSIFFLVF